MAKITKMKGSEILALVETDIEKGVQAFNDKMEEIGSPFRMHRCADVKASMGTGNCNCYTTYVNVELGAMASFEKTNSNQLETSVDWI